MLVNIKLRMVSAVALALGAITSALADQSTEASKSRIVTALQNVMSLDRPGQDGYATIWDGNKYVQCGRLFDRSLRCEAAGALMQPSLEHVLTPERVSRLTALGWRLDPRFGNYAQDFPTGIATSLVADKIMQVLVEAYDADASTIEVNSIWVKSEPCPPRNGPSQNLAAMINDAPSMAPTRFMPAPMHPRQTALRVLQPVLRKSWQTFTGCELPGKYNAYA
jgi:hypothetical protein